MKITIEDNGYKITIDTSEGTVNTNGKTISMSTPQRPEIENVSDIFSGKFTSNNSNNANKQRYFVVRDKGQDLYYHGTVKMNGVDVYLPSNESQQYTRDPLSPDILQHGMSLGLIKEISKKEYYHHDDE